MTGASCGLDFGTSNSTVGRDVGRPDHLLPLEDGRPTLPSAVFFHAEDGSMTFGRRAVTDYLAGHEGRLLRSLKSLLGSSTLDERTDVGGRTLAFRDLIAAFVRELKKRAESSAGASLDHAVIGRPVHFVDDDAKADRLAEDSLRTAAIAAGFRRVSFQFEPIAAAFDHESRLSREETVLVVDVGGGTSDFSVIRVGPARAPQADRQADILASGGVHVGGTDFDRALSLCAALPAFGYRGRLRDGKEAPAAPYLDLATWHLINTLYTRKAWSKLETLRREAVDRDAVERLLDLVRHRDGHWLAMQVEAAKIALGDAPSTHLVLSRGTNALAREIGRPELDDAIARLLGRVEASILSTLADAGLAAASIDTVLYAGGSSSLPALRRRVARLLPDARTAQGDLLGSIGAGLAIEARRRYG